MKHARPRYRLGRHPGGGHTLAGLATAHRFGLENDAELAPRLAEYATGKTVARFPQFDATLRKVWDLRGQVIKRWTSEWAGLWMILVKSSENQAWPWSELDERAEETFAVTYPSLYRHFKPLEESLRKQQDTDIARNPQFALAREPVYLLNTAYV